MYYILFICQPGCVNTTEVDIKKACRMSKPPAGGAGGAAGPVVVPAAPAAGVAAAINAAKQPPKVTGVLFPYKCAVKIVTVLKHCTSILIMKFHNPCFLENDGVLS